MYKCSVKKENTGDCPVAVVLGGTVPHGELLQRLTKRGYYTVLIDYFENPPAAKFADVHYQETAMDADIVKGIAKAVGADIILTPCLDQQMNIAMQVSEELGLPHPFSSDTAFKVTNKEAMKGIMLGAAIPTTKYCILEKEQGAEDLNENLTYPLIVKPVDSCGSAGVIKVEETDKLDYAIENARKYGSDERVIVEEFAQGTESGVHFFIKNGKPNLIFGTCKIVKITEKFPRQLCNIYIPHLNPQIKAQFIECAEKMVKAFELPENTPLFMQTKTKNGKFNVIEFSPRIAGGTSSDVAYTYANMDLLEFSIDSYLKKAPQADTVGLKKHVCCYPIYCRDGIFDRVTGVERLEKEGIIDRMYLLKERGTEIHTDKPSNSNVVKFLISGVTLDECYEKMKHVEEIADVMDFDGISMVDRSVTITRELVYQNVSELI